VIQPLQTLLDKQYSCPNGLLGRYVGSLMARQHKPETAWTLAQLRLTPSDHVLEIGCGAGKALELAAQELATGHIVGIDTSSTMVEVSSRSNALMIKQGQTEILRADVTHLPFADKQFNKIWSIHTLYFWSDYMQAITEIERVLKPGGVAILTFSPGKVDATQKSDFQLQVENTIIPIMQQSGFTTVTLEQGPASREYQTLAIVGQK
jgi:ubiquinone/menaquinone biosynthesis C-methylase UbiE